MQYVAIAAAVVSAVGSVEAGQAKERMYRLQGQQADLEGRQKALQYEQRANQVLERLNMTNAAAHARAAAGGVQAFEGSADALTSQNNRRAGRDFSVELTNAGNAQQFGMIQQKLYNSAGSAAARAGYFDAIGKLGMAAATYSTMGGGGSPNAPIEERSTGFGMDKA